MDAIVTPRERNLEIVSQVAEKHGVSLKEIMGHRRAHHISAARFDAYAEMRKKGLSLPQIGRFFGRDHTTILHGVRRVTMHPAVRALYNAMREHKLSQSALSVQSGIDQSTVSKWFGDGRDPTVGNLEAALNCVGLRLAVLPLNRGEGE